MVASVQALLTAAICLLLCLSSSALSMQHNSTRMAVTPLEKVITLLENLKSEVEREGNAEAGTYAEFSCMCKDETLDKSNAIKHYQDVIDELSSNLASNTALKEEQADEVAARSKDMEALNRQLANRTAECIKEEGIYDSNTADVESGLEGVRKALNALQSTKAASLLDVSAEIKKNVEVASVMGIFDDIPKTSRHQAVALLQQKAGFRVDPADSDYESHTGPIIEILEKLQVFLTDQKSNFDMEWTKTKKACDESKVEMNKQLGLNAEETKTLGESISTLTMTIAKDRSDLIQLETDLKTDKVYLQDLTKLCEERANEFDKSSSHRNDELKVLAQVLEIMGSEAVQTDKTTNQPTFLHISSRPAVKVSLRAEASFMPTVGNLATLMPVSFLQEEKALRGSARQFADKVLLTKRDHSLAFLMREGNRLRSRTLESLAIESAASPFKKVKDLIQQLIERLLREAKEETTKKGFCDKELGQANNDRTSRFEAVQRLDAEISALETKKDELEMELEELTKAISNYEFALQEAKKTRAEEKKENMEQIKEAKDGREAVTKCIVIMKSFYGSFLQINAQSKRTKLLGPNSADGIIGLLDVIQTDFERSIQTTKDAESKSFRAFIKFEAASKSDLSSKTTKKELDTEDLATTTNTIESKMKDMQNQMNLLDSTLKQVEDLKPLCIDTGMTYEEKVAKRDEEVKALKKALCILDPEGVEASCT